MTLLLGFGAEDVAESVIAEVEVEVGRGSGDRLARRLRPTLYVDTLVAFVGSPSERLTNFRMRRIVSVGAIKFARM